MGDLWLNCIVEPCVSVFHPVISGLSDSLTTEILQNTSFLRWCVGDVANVVHLVRKCPAIPTDLKRPNMEVQDVRKVTFLCSSPLLTRKILSCHRSTAVSNYLQNAIAGCFFPFCLWFGVKELNLFPVLNCTYLPGWTSYSKLNMKKPLDVSMRLHREISFISMPENKTKEIHSEPSPILLKEHKALKNPYSRKNVMVVAKSCTKKLVNIKMGSSLILQFFHACNLGLNFQLNKQLRMQNVIIMVISL